MEWIRADILDWSPPRTYGLWHDRAVLHFLVNARSRARYRETLLAALRPGGHVVAGTFAEDGPTRCSGLPVARYDAEALANVFGPGFATVARRRDEHSHALGRAPGVHLGRAPAPGLTSGHRPSRAVTGGASLSSHKGN